MAAASKGKNKKIIVTGPTLKIDGQEIVTFTSEYSSNPNMRLLDRTGLEQIAMQTHQSFVQSVHAALKGATKSKTAKSALSRKAAPEEIPGE